MFHPWGKLRELAHIAIIWTRPHSHAPAATDGSSRIWLDPTLTQDECRCALTHELIHLQRGHHGCQSPAIERAVRTEAAHLLVSLEDLTLHAGWARCVSELADDLSVTEQVMIDRLQALDHAQHQALWPPEFHTA